MEVSIGGAGQLEAAYRMARHICERTADNLRICLIWLLSHVSKLGRTCCRRLTVQSFLLGKKMEGCTMVPSQRYCHPKFA
eukprot:156133-Pelagomonas_calceolata.AAC.6